MDSFLSDIVTRLSGSYAVRTVYTANNAEINAAVQWADVIWVEWANELTVALSHGLPLTANKRVICRLHSYEAFTPFMQQIKWERVDDLIFIAEHIRDHCCKKLPDLAQRVRRLHVVPNGVDLDRWLFKKRAPGKNLAFLGYINHKKGPMLLLHAFADLVRRDPSYRLFLGGRYQDERYVLYYDQMIEAMGLRDNVQFDGWIDDVPRWLNDKQYIVCSSVLESQGMGLIQAMACGLKPVIHNFVGADQIYDRTFLWNSIPEFSEMILSSEFDSQLYRRFVADRYSLERQTEAIDRIVANTLSEIVRPSPVS
jgi:glycosyltransferase involved in cell wall biosynthesis